MKQFRAVKKSAALQRLLRFRYRDNCLHAAPYNSNEIAIRVCSGYLLFLGDGVRHGVLGSGPRVRLTAIEGEFKDRQAKCAAG